MLGGYRKEQQVDLLKLRQKIKEYVREKVRRHRQKIDAMSKAGVRPT